MAEEGSISKEVLLNHQGASFLVGHILQLRHQGQAVFQKQKRQKLRLGVVVDFADEFKVQMLKLLSVAYSSIYVQEADRILGTSTAETTACKYPGIQLLALAMLSLRFDNVSC